MDDVETWLMDCAFWLFVSFFFVLFEVPVDWSRFFMLWLELFAVLDDDVLWNENNRLSCLSIFYPSCNTANWIRCVHYGHSIKKSFSLKVKVPKYERLFVNSDGCTFVRKFPHPRGLPTLSENVVKFSDYAEIFFQL